LIVPSDSLRAFLEKASKSYHRQLTPDVVGYLAERGIDREAAERFQLGFVDDPEPGHEAYRGCLAIPYLTPSGSVVSVRFRTLPPAEKKYMTVAGDTPRLYNTESLERGTRSVCVTEGELDCVIAELCGLPAVGLPGATSWKKIFSRLLAHYENVFLLSDDDSAGQAFAETLGRGLPNVRNCPMRGGDVTSFYLEHGPEALKEKVGVAKR
jgi:DNA primase